MKQLRTAILFLGAVILVSMLHAAQLQWSSGAPSIIWVVVFGMIALFIQPRRATLFVVLSASVLELQSALPFGVQLSAVLIAYTCMRFAQERILKAEAVYAAVIHTAVWTLLFNICLVTAIVLLQLAGIVQLSGFVVLDQLAATAWQLVFHGILVGIGFSLFQLYKRTFIRRKSDTILYA